MLVTTVLNAFDKTEKITAENRYHNHFGDFVLHFHQDYRGGMM